MIDREQYAVNKMRVREMIYLLERQIEVLDTLRMDIILTPVDEKMMFHDLKEDFFNINNPLFNLEQRDMLSKNIMLFTNMIRWFDAKIEEQSSNERDTRMKNFVNENVKLLNKRFEEEQT